MKTNEQVSIEELIMSETQNRIDEMSQSDYEFPQRISKGDVIAMLIAGFSSLILILLCMLGVIK